MKTENNDTATEVLIGLIIGIPLSLLVSGYLAFVITKIVCYYNIPLSLTFKQWYGIDAIVGLLILNVKKNSEAGIKNVLGGILSTAIIVTFIWFLLYIMSTIIS